MRHAFLGFLVLFLIFRLRSSDGDGDVFNATRLVIVHFERRLEHSKMRHLEEVSVRVVMPIEHSLHHLSEEAVRRMMRAKRLHVYLHLVLGRIVLAPGV